MLNKVAIAVSLMVFAFSMKKLSDKDKGTDMVAYYITLSVAILAGVFFSFKEYNEMISYKFDEDIVDAFLL